MKTKQFMCGITLIELLTTLSAVAVTLTVGVPTFTTIQATVCRGEATSALMTSFKYARSEAARHSSAVQLCASTDGLTCSTATPPNWSTGWILLADLDDDGAIDDLVHYANFTEPGFTLRTQLVDQNDTAVTAITLSSNGFPNATGTFTFCDAREYRVLTLGYVGRIEQSASGQGCP